MPQGTQEPPHTTTPSQELDVRGFVLCCRRDLRDALVTSDSLC